MTFLHASRNFAIAFSRGLARRGSTTLGNSWVDLTRAMLYVLLPMAVLLAAYLVWAGVPQTLTGALPAITLEGQHQED